VLQHADENRLVLRLAAAHDEHRDQQRGCHHTSHAGERTPVPEALRGALDRFGALNRAALGGKVARPGYLPYPGKVSRASKIAVALAVVLVTSPVWGFEVLYHFFLPAERPQLPATTDATPLEMDALWLEAGERPAMSQNVTPLWALNYFRVYKPGADPRLGLHAAMRIARLRGGQESREGVRASQLRHSITELAVMVWLTRTATADGLKRALAEGTYFGRHAYGIKAARTAYYGCSASALATAQVAFLVGLVQNPSGLNPVAHPDRAAKRRQYILKSLADAGVISEAEEAKAAAENAESTVVPKAVACP
jgi:hypothetical protein